MRITDGFVYQLLFTPKNYMKRLIAFSLLTLHALSAFSTPVDKTLLNKYCIDEACLFTPIDDIPQSLVEKSENATKEYNRMKALPPSCDGIGVGNLETTSSSGKAIYLGLSATPEMKGKHYRVAHIRVRAPGVYSKEQLLSVVKDMMKKFSFPPKEFIDMGGWVSVTKKDKGLSIQLTGSTGSEGINIEMSYTDPSKSSNDFARSPICNSATPKF